jgi:hypothetical protein
VPTTLFLTLVRAGLGLPNQHDDSWQFASGNVDTYIAEISCNV